MAIQFHSVFDLRGIEEADGMMDTLLKNVHHPLTDRLPIERRERQADVDLILQQPFQRGSLVRKVVGRAHEVEAQPARVVSPEPAEPLVEGEWIDRWTRGRRLC